MDTSPTTQTYANQIQAVIHQFLQERLQPKLDKLKKGEEKERQKLLDDYDSDSDPLQQERLQFEFNKLKEGEDEKRQKLLDAHRPENWIADAARRVGQIQQATHALKYTHPDAKGTSLISQGNAAVGAAMIGTHTLNGAAVPDVVGNSAALDVYKFLRLEVDGKTLLMLANESNPALAAAFSSDGEEAQAWMDAFAGLTEPKGQPSSHRLAKQLYWPLGNGEYHLLAPLFPTSLVHRVYSGIREDRFSESAKAAREAHRNKLPFAHGYREYPNFAIQKFGGTKPQNISQLNSERHGENYLLASLPPVWNSPMIRPPLKVGSIFDHWLLHSRRITQLTRTLRQFLAKVQPANNIGIRNKRAELVALIRDEVMQQAAHLQDLPAGWSQHEECRLNRDECYWLDPSRGIGDEDFAAEHAASDWKENISHRFANWLNARLNTDKAPMGDPEHEAWESNLGKELRMMREELGSHE